MNCISESPNIKTIAEKTGLSINDVEQLKRNEDKS